MTGSNEPDYHPGRRRDSGTAGLSSVNAVVQAVDVATKPASCRPGPHNTCERTCQCDMTAPTRESCAAADMSGIYVFGLASLSLSPCGALSMAGRSCPVPAATSAAQDAASLCSGPSTS